MEWCSVFIMLLHPSLQSAARGEQSSVSVYWDCVQSAAKIAASCAKTKMRGRTDVVFRDGERWLCISQTSLIRISLSKVMKSAEMQHLQNVITACQSCGSILTHCCWDIVCCSVPRWYHDHVLFIDAVFLCAHSSLRKSLKLNNVVCQTELFRGALNHFLF